MPNNTKQEELTNAFMKRFRSNAHVVFTDNGERVAFGWKPREMRDEVEKLINQQVVQALEKIKSNLDDLPHVNYKGGYQIPYEEIEGMIEAIEKEYRNE